MTGRGERILQLGRKHLGEPYILGALAPKDNPKWKGPWDCAECASWLVFQTAGVLYGCASDAGDPATADAYTGYWARDVEALGVKIPVEQRCGRPARRCCAALSRARPGTLRVTLRVRLGSRRGQPGELASTFSQDKAETHADTTVNLNGRISRIAVKSFALLVTTVAPTERAESAIKTSFTSEEEPATWYPRDTWSARKTCPASS